MSALENVIEMLRHEPNIETLIATTTALATQLDGERSNNALLREMVDMLKTQVRHD